MDGKLSKCGEREKRGLRATGPEDWMKKAKKTSSTYYEEYFEKRKDESRDEIQHDKEVVEVRITRPL